VSNFLCSAVNDWNLVCCLPGQHTWVCRFWHISDKLHFYVKWTGDKIKLFSMYRSVGLYTMYLKCISRVCGLCISQLNHDFIKTLLLSRLMELLCIICTWIKVRVWVISFYMAKVTSMEKKICLKVFFFPNVIVKCHRFKGIVHPKINILSFTHTQVVLNLCFFLLLNTK